MKDIILNTLEESIALQEQFIRTNLDLIVTGADRIAACIASGHKILIFGNGGSAADAQHMAAEFINRFRIERPPLAAIALTTDTSVITSIGNDYHFDEIFAKQVKGLGKKDDIALGISTSGNSRNVIQAIKAARDIGMFTIGLTGHGGELAACADMVFSVKSDITARVQEAHMALEHILCDLADRILFGSLELET
jgi:D-sedoheptulose 7-phosphate isomerase